LGAFGSGDYERVVLLPAVDPLQPGLGAAGGIFAAAGGQQRFERGLHIGHHRYIGGAGLAELSGIDVDVDHLGPRREAIQAAGDAIVEAGPGSDQQIALGDGEVGVGRAVHAEHAHRQGVLLIKRTLAHQGGGDGQAEALCQLMHLLVGAAADGAAAHVEQGPAGLADQGQGRING
jgi:hypothetical protein